MLEGSVRYSGRIDQVDFAGPVLWKRINGPLHIHYFEKACMLSCACGWNGKKRSFSHQRFMVTEATRHVCLVDRGSE